MFNNLTMDPPERPCCLLCTIFARNASCASRQHLLFVLGDQRGAGAETFKDLNMDPPERPCCLLCMISPSRCAPPSGVHVSAERPSGVLSRDPYAGCYLSGDNLASRPGLFRKVIATTVATSRHLQSITNGIVAGVAGRGSCAPGHNRKAQWRKCSTT